MAKLNLIDWSSTVFVACSSFANFENIINKYSKRYPNITFGWWPTAPDSYYVSGFSNPASIDYFFSEITQKTQNTGIPVLLDLELPRSKITFLKNILNLRKNRKKIYQFTAESFEKGLVIYTAEIPVFGGLASMLLRMFGITPPPDKKHIRISMCYSSMLEKYFGRIILGKIKNYEKKLSLKYGNISLGLGTIAVGILGSEPILSPERIREDLKWAKESKAKEVFIFRLGGLDDSYISAIKSV